MPLSKIEAYIYGGDCGHFVTAFNLTNSDVTIEFEPMDNDRPDGATSVVAVFPNAVLNSYEEDPEWNRQFPLDPIGFDASPSGDRWKFVLHCDSVEWIWESEWPILRISSAE
jgi:hypothetical protein